MWPKFFTGTVDRPSPSDIFRNDLVALVFQGGVYRDGSGRWRVNRTHLRIPFNDDPELIISSIPGTLSMDPVFDKEHNNLYLKPVSNADHSILVNWLSDEWFLKDMGNILVYVSPARYAVHRLKKIEIRDGRRRWFFKGDNNAFQDPTWASDTGVWWLYAGTLC